MNAISPRTLPAIRFWKKQLAHFLIACVLPTVIALTGPFYLPSGWLSWTGVTLWIGTWFLVGCVGVTVGLHRHYAHRAFSAPNALRYILGGAGSMAAQGPLNYWVALHRCHHAFSDQAGDPHSPHCAVNGASGISQGFLQGHVGWVIRHDVPMPSQYAPDLAKDPVSTAVSRHYWWFVLAGILLPAAAGAWFCQSVSGAIIGAYWGGFVRLAAGHQIIWAVNSVCHFFGRRPHDTGCASTNQWLLAIPSFGESWHNNHHRAPASARFCERWWQIDLGWVLIRALATSRLVNRVRVC